MRMIYAPLNIKLIEFIRKEQEFYLYKNQFELIQIKNRLTSEIADYEYNKICTSQESSPDMVYFPDPDIMYELHLTESSEICLLLHYKHINLQRRENMYSFEEHRFKSDRKKIIEMVTEIPEITYLEMLALFGEYEIEMELEYMIEHKMIRRIVKDNKSYWEHNRSKNES